MFSILSSRANSRFIFVSRLLLNTRRFYSDRLISVPESQTLVPNDPAFISNPKTSTMNAQVFCLNDYDCVGFDLDHTLCTYRLQPLSHLIHETLATFLIEQRGYPRALSEPIDLSFAQKGIVLDKRRGNFLKLDQAYRIVQATHGTSPMLDKDVKQTYGLNHAWEESRGIPSKLVESGAMSENFYVFKDYFVTPGACLCARVVDLLDEQNGRDPGNESYSFWGDYLDGLHYMYDRMNFKNGGGGFFPELRTHPERYLMPCSDRVKEWLKALRKEKTVFLLTSSNHDSAAFLAEYCLGVAWREYFDLVLTFAKKPGFFWKDTPFCRIDGESEIEGVEPYSMGAHSVYSQGNFQGLREACGGLSGKKNPKIVYFGDSLIEDMYAASEVAGCDTVAIVEEIADEADCRVWGSFFDGGADSGSNLSLWAHLISRHSKVAVANLESISSIGIHKKVQCFDGVSPLSGYFPSVPKVLFS